MGEVEVPNWLKGLPLAPVFRPTDTEFADPIAYISKIEKEASAFGICKIVPPLPRPSKKYVFANLNKSLSKCPDMGTIGNSRLAKNGSGESGAEGDVRAVFTTRHQELGQSQNVKKMKGTVNNNSNSPQVTAHKQVWQSGEMYTLEQFEAKSKVFARSQLGMIKAISPEAVEALFWKAASQKPIYVEYANDVPGSAFGEQECELKYFSKRRRSRMSYQRCNEDFECRKDEANNMINPCSSEKKDTSCANEPSSSPETSNVLVPQRAVSSRKASGGRDKCSNSNEVEGTAGWKLSNSPWNLQVIARSPGSLTRFMPDDIPGVTSPMVYIGMLFSWFAWHVEDHELHSMNFLHTGAPKTWYSVPGDYAFAFEEVVRMEAYGGNNDRLAALTFLGEKTTLLSPEVIVAAGIPCCRLIQHPGEFVITFPRAYHIGFSHGFNCGEAANFATPQWIRFAKEAAVRRAAMNYLPMLSHQQLLYLLTMSFVSRVPRSLLPGARSSRRRDRQREDRELLVKKAFLGDVSNHNDLLPSLLEKDNSFRAVVWNPDLLPSVSKESSVPEEGGGLSSTQKDNCAQQCSDSDNSSINLFKEMTLYMEALSGSYLDKDDLLFDFQVDSGTLVCVACGILGFPFMAVMQPSQTASEEFLRAEQTPQHSHEQVHVAPRTDSGSSLDISSGLLRPRIFCLEHAIEVKDLLQCKGGANVLIICHSDYQKMKVYASTIAEEIGASFNYKEIRLDNASKEDLNLIDVAIANEQHGSVSEDWTSRLGVNLRYCMKVRKNSTSKRVQHALAVGRLFSNENTCPSSLLSIKWKSRKSRSRFRSDTIEDREDTDEIKKKDEKQVGNGVKKEETIIQYTRRNAKGKPSSTETTRDQGPCKKHELREVSSATNGAEINTLSSSRLAEMGHEIQVLEVMGTIGSDFLPGNVENSLSKVSSFVGNVDVQILNGTSGDMVMEQNTVSSCPIEKGDDLSKRTVIKDGNSISRDDDSPMVANVLMDKVADLDNCIDSHAVEITEIQSNGSALSEVVTSNCQVLHETPSIKSAEAVCEKSSSSNLEKQIEEDHCATVSHESCSEVESSDCAKENAPSNEAIKSEVLQKINASGSVGQKGAHGLEKDQPMSLMSEECTVVSSEDILDDHRPENGTFDLECSQVLTESCSAKQQRNEGQVSSSGDCLLSTTLSKRKRRSEIGLQWANEMSLGGFMRSPCEGLRPRTGREMVSRSDIDIPESSAEKPMKKVKGPKNNDSTVDSGNKREKRKFSYKCSIDGCRMRFKTKEELIMHKRNRCPIDGCGKKFRSHKYAVLHQRVHEDDRPLKCPWKGCSMTFKWAWARTEHIRVHTGERPYECKVEGCGRSFRFVSDFSRHRRKTGHYMS